MKWAIDHELPKLRKLHLIAYTGSPHIGLSYITM